MLKARRPRGDGGHFLESVRYSNTAAKGPYADFLNERLMVVILSVKQMRSPVGLQSVSHGTRRRFDKLVLATGAKPRMPQIAGVGFANVVALRSLADARRLHGLIGPVADVVIIGGGF